MSLLSPSWTGSPRSRRLCGLQGQRLDPHPHQEPHGSLSSSWICLSHQAPAPPRGPGCMSPRRHLRFCCWAARLQACREVLAVATCTWIQREAWEERKIENEERKMREREVEEKRARRKEGGCGWERELQKRAKGTRALLCSAML